MRRFLLFTGRDYYPSGGWNDFVRDFETEEDAVVLGKALLRAADTSADGQWAHVVDTETGQMTEVSL